MFFLNLICCFFLLMKKKKNEKGEKKILKIELDNVKLKKEKLVIF